MKSSRSRAVNFIKLLFRLAPRSCLKWPIMGCPMEKWRWLIRVAGTREEGKRDRPAEDSGRRHLNSSIANNRVPVNRTARSN